MPQRYDPVFVDVLSLSFEISQDQHNCIVTLRCEGLPGEVRVTLHELLTQPFWTDQLKPRVRRRLQQLHSLWGCC